MRKLTMAKLLILAFMYLMGNWAAGQETFRVEEFFDSLASRNKCPHIASIGSGKVQFSSDFDWEEYRRSLAILRELPSHTERVWKSLPEKLLDERYVTTVATGSGAKLNVTISAACMIFIRATLTQPYLEIAPKGVNRKTMSANLVPEFLESPSATRQWLLDRKDKPIHNLQIEMCQWAKTELQSRAFSRMNPKDKTDWLSAIDREISKLSSDEVAAQINAFSHFEDLVPERSEGKVDKP